MVGLRDYAFRVQRRSRTGRIADTTEADRPRSRGVSALWRHHESHEQTSESAGSAPSVTIGAGVTASIYTEDHQPAWVFGFIRIQRAQSMSVR